MTAEILVADDDPDLRRLVEMKLAMAGFTASVVADGTEALGALEAGEFSLAILDVRMPGVDGIEACRRIRRMPGYRTLPILILTARARPDDIQRGLEAGATGYMVKPFSPRELSVRVAEMLTHATAA